MEPIDPCSPPDLRHLRRLTDDFGIFQHTSGATPDPRYGYAVDDAARALMVTVETSRIFQGHEYRPPGMTDHRSLQDLAGIYLRFIEHCQYPGGWFHNFVAVDRSLTPEARSYDAQGRVLWALSIATRDGGTIGERAAAALRRVLRRPTNLPPLRAKALALLGLSALLEHTDVFNVGGRIRRLSVELLRQYDGIATARWPWFEETLSYANGVLPHALLAVARNAARVRADRDAANRAREVGLGSLQFLLHSLTVGDVPAPVGNRGWYPRGGSRTLYDQQCEDAGAMALATVEAWRVTGEQQYRDAAETWWSWFFGNNTKRLALVREEDGAVYDGLTADGVNENRGAESVISYLLVHLSLAGAFCGGRARL